ncbi:MAG: hydratase [Oscillospiraceae bacterium]|nr:hydratase [Oscillospiraceae bacterium]
MKMTDTGVYLLGGRRLIEARRADRATDLSPFSEAEIENAYQQTISYRILQSHNHSGDMDRLSLKFDALVAQDMTYMGVLQTAIACNVKEFPIPFVLSSCHNALCYNDGTSNEDDHLFAMGAARKYGGIFLPGHQAVMHQFMRERFAGGGTMILGADSHTRYGALGTMATGEGGGELAKQLLGKTYDISRPETVLVYLTGAPRPGVGPQDFAIFLIGSVFKNGFVKNKTLEFCGPGIANLSVDYRNGIDVMTTESSAMFSIWETDEKVREFLTLHGRPEAFRELHPGRLAYYDSLIEIDLGEIEPMIALPFHPSNAYTIRELNENAEDILHAAELACSEQMKEFGIRVDLRSKIVNGRVRADQGVIAGCAGGLFENVAHAADILRGRSIGNEGFSLNIYPASQPVNYELMRHGIAADILDSGANLRSAFCGPCFGAGDVPFNGGFSIRHTTRNYSNREGSRPGKGQMATAALMDAMSIAATSINGGFLTPATELDIDYRSYEYRFNGSIYDKRLLDCFGRAEPQTQLVKGPGIGDIPKIPALGENLLVKCAALITDPVTTTDELIPNGESSSYRSNFSKIADYTLSAKVPEYVGRCKRIRAWQETITAGGDPFQTDGELKTVAQRLTEAGFDCRADNTCVGSLLYANSPGDGSAREYAASNQKVLGGWANICRKYATKRYRSNLINWGLLPFTYQGEILFEVGSFLWIPEVRKQLLDGAESMAAYVVGSGGLTKIELSLDTLTDKEREIIAKGCLINYNRINE